MEREANLALARESRRAKFAAGERIEKLNPIEKAKRAPKSLTKALRAYYWDLEKVLANRGSPDGGEQRRIAEERYKVARSKSREVGLPAVIKDICRDCVGGYDDPGPQDRVRNCPCTSCPLHPVRGWRTP